MTKKTLLTAAIVKPTEQTTIPQIGPLAFASREKAEDRIKAAALGQKQHVQCESQCLRWAEYRYTQRKQLYAN